MSESEMQLGERVVNTDGFLKIHLPLLPLDGRAALGMSSEKLRWSNI